MIIITTLPEEGTTSRFALHLVSDHVDVIVPDPLVALEGVGPHAALGVLHHRVAFPIDLMADLVVGQEARGPCELARLTLGTW